MTKEELKKEIEEAAIENKPKNWRKGQFVFNYIDEIYNVARDVQFIDKVDCFHNDKLIDDFIEKATERINQNNNESR